MTLRAAPPAAAFDDPLGALQALHRRLESRCGLLERLAEHVGRHGSDADARATAGHVMRCFDEDCPLHDADLETDLLPLLRAAVPPPEQARVAALAAALAALHADARAAYDAVRPPLAAIADGRLAKIDRALAGRLQALCLARIEREQSELLALARAHLDAAALARLGRAMAARRDAAYPSGPE
ncbi:MAG: hemerythrin domain-containing protein [Burkholderiales bacterium]